MDLTWNQESVNADVKDGLVLGVVPDEGLKEVVGMRHHVLHVRVFLKGDDGKRLFKVICQETFRVINHSFEIFKFVGLLGKFNTLSDTFQLTLRLWSLNFHLFKLSSE